MNIKTKAVPLSIDEKNYKMRVVMSAEVVDRQGDIVDIDTLSFEEFQTNPVLLQFHDYYKMSVGRVENIEKTVYNGVKTLEADIIFAVDEYDVAKTMFKLYAGGFMSAFSIGFSVGRVEVDQATNTTRLYDCKLLELSCVAVPANQLALAKTKGIEISSPSDYIPNFETTVRENLIAMKTLLTDEKIEKEDGTAEDEKPAEKQELDKEVIKKTMLKRALELAIRKI